ncbi:MAG: hypothetical protein IPL46_00835 [Saprospiraceae bacterium]|nr:hypothetical protein [Saprospiraceae bacterium]
MNRLILILLILIGFVDLRASPQSPDFLILDQDTLPLYHLPLHSLDSLTQKRFFDNLQSDTLEFGFSFNLWRGYQAYWQIIDMKLYLVGLKNYLNSEAILKNTFPEHFENVKVLAYWYNSYLSIGKDKVLKYDGVFSYNFLKSKIFEFENGILTSQGIVDNYINLPNGISRFDREKVTNRIFSRIKKLDWKNLSDCGCDDEYWITIDDKGKISKVEFVPTFDLEERNIEYAIEFKMCTDTLFKHLEEMQFDIIKWNGQPYTEKIRIEVFYDKKLENWTE